MEIATGGTGERYAVALDYEVLAGLIPVPALLLAAALEHSEEVT
jgi:hypothetical protein